MEIIKGWLVTNIPVATRTKIKTYAAQNDLTIAQALTKLIDEV